MSSYCLAGPNTAILSREEAEKILQPHIELLNRLIDEGWEAWKTDYAHKEHILDGRARAAIIYAEIVHRAVEAFAGIDGVKLIRRRGSLMIFIGDLLTLRFKKIRRSGRCSNIHTQIQIKFLGQYQLPGMVDGTLVHAGYQLDELQQGIERKAVVCQLNKEVRWQIPLSGTLAEVVHVPDVETPNTPSSAPRFVAKKGLAMPAAAEANAEKE